MLSIQSRNFAQSIPMLVQMMKNFFIASLTVGLVVFTATIVTGQQNSKDDIVLTIEDETVTLADFEAVFRKNNRDTAITAEALDEYMELFINFKLKVREAREEGLDTTASFLRELSGYRRQLSRPYLVDNDLLEDLIQEAYERRKYEVKASHILINAEPNAAPEDTLRAWNRIMRLRERILAGEDFATVATSKSGSEDPSARENKGNLGYFTSFQMVYPFETAAYETPVGEVSMPIRSRFGYHIVKTHDKRPARGEVRVAHIMLRHKDTTDAEARAEVEARIHEIHSLLEEGGDFAELAQRYSQDQSTSRNGGELPWFGTGKMVESFENAAFALTQDGDISNPVLTNYGWHIIKRLEYKPIPTFEEMETEIRKKVSRDSRAEMTRQSFINKLKAEYGTSPNTKNLKPLFKAAQKDDSTFVDEYGIRVAKQKALDKPLFNIEDQRYTVKDFYNFLNTAPIRKRGARAEDIINEKLEEYIRKELMAYEDANLERKHNEFRLLMNEYHDGILLFELTDKKVWSRAVRDTLGLEAFYEANKDRFMWDDRAVASIYACNSAKNAKSVERMLKKGATPSEIKDSVNKSSALNVRIEEDTWERGEQRILDLLDWNKGEIAVLENEGVHYVVHLQDVIPAQPKAIDEARGIITAEYQNHLEKSWIETLRNNFNYTVNREVLHSLQ